MQVSMLRMKSLITHKKRNPSVRIANIDGDIPVYSIGFVTENEPVTHALNTMKKFINNTTEAAGCGDYRIFITGPDNFRDKVAVTKPYKGNRKQNKPKHYEAIREYLLTRHNAVLTYGIEADDALGLNQTDDTVLCSLDKDLKMIAGCHYNWKTTIQSTVSQWDADKFFMEQWMTGDVTDNIVGIFKWGPKKSEKLLEECTSIHQMHELVKYAYMELHDYSPEYMEEMGHLIWMQRPNQITYKDFLDAKIS